MKSKMLRYVSAAAVVLLTLALTAGAASAAAWPPLASRRANPETVTISREEYESLMRFSKLSDLMDLVDAYYYEDADAEKMLDAAAEGLMYGVGDIYTCYYTKEEMDKQNEEAEGQYVGIGAQLLADPSDSLITVTRVFKGSPAEGAGIHTGDKIVYVNDVYYSAREIDDAVSVMRGHPGESVKVTVMRGEETIDFDIIRNSVNINYVEHEILDGNIGYVIVYDFLGQVADGFKAVMEEFRAANVSGVIIDLRNNGGGIVDLAVDMLDVIVPEGTVVSLRFKTGYEWNYTVDDEYYDVPLVILMNEYSASASEILIGAVRDYGAGKLVGTKTFGKGVVQDVIPFIDGSGVKITSARYYTPSGECIHGVGIEPDYEVALDEDIVTMYGINNIPHEEDAQLQKAIELLTAAE